MKKVGITPPSGNLKDIKVGGFAKPLNGAAFFKKTSNTIALLGLVSESAISDCQKNALEPSQKEKSQKGKSQKGKSQEGAKRQRLSATDTFQCGYRLSCGEVLNLYQIALAIDDDLPRDNIKVIPALTGSLHTNVF